MARQMSIKEATRRVCQRWPFGQKKLGYQIHAEVVSELGVNGRRIRPLDSTVLRRLREVAHEFGVRPMKASESEYVREDPITRKFSSPGEAIGR